MTVSSLSRTDRESLVESHVPLVHSLARRYAGRGETLEELVQVGALGLVKAAKRFDPSRGVAFAAFAAPVIEGELRRHLRDRSSVLRIPRDLQRASRDLRRRRGQLTAAFGRFPTNDELAAALNIDRERIERALRAELAREALPLAEHDRGAEHADESERDDSDERVSLVRCMQVLDERTRKLVFLRFHADMTERQIAQELGISQAQVSRLLNHALARMRAELTAAGGGGSARDSTASSVIPQRSRGDSAHDDARERPGHLESSRADADQATGTIAGVPSSQQSSDVAHYLELPYTVGARLERAGEDASWVATVAELPGCAAQGRTPDEAVQLLRSAMQQWLEAALAQGREIPLPGGQGPAKPKPASTHSGRFLVRMPGTLHAQLAQAAEAEQLSLNRFVTNVLAASLSSTSRPASTAELVTQQSTQPREPTRVRAHRPSRALRIALAVNIFLVVVAAAAAIVLLVLALHNGV